MFRKIYAAELFLIRFIYEHTLINIDITAYYPVVVYIGATF